MKLRVLGNAGRYLAPLSGGSGYLVESEGVRVLLDCGGGARDALARLDLVRLDAVVLSHFHHDHVLDFVTLGALLDARTTVFLPPGEETRLQALAQAYVFDGRFSFDGPLVEARPGAVHEVGPLRLSFAPTRHSAPAFATRIEARDGASLVYASDSAPCDPLAALSQDADLLLMHTLLPTVEPGSDHERIHATAQTAARLAHEASARRLLLSHRYHLVAEEDFFPAAEEHPSVELAREGATYELRRRGT